MASREGWRSQERLPMHHASFAAFNRRLVSRHRKISPMVTLRVRTALAVLATALVLSLQPARAAQPDYKLGDVAEADIVTPVALSVINPEATEVLKKKV